MTEQEMLKRILDYKLDRGYSEEDWAKYLGVSWGLWSMIRNGKRRISNNFLAIIAAKCPEIQLEAFQFMRERGGRSKEVERV